MNRVVLVSPFFLALFLSACGGSSGPGPATPTTGLGGTVVAPPGGDVAGTVVVACLPAGDDACDPQSETAQITRSGSSAAYSFDSLETASYVVVAFKDVNANGQPDDGDFYGESAPVTPPARVNVTMEVLGAGGGGGGNPAPAGGAVFPDLAEGTNGDGPVLLSDAAGTLHLLYTAVTADSKGVYPIRYGTCSSNCSTEAGWTFTTVGDAGLWGGYGQLALGADGRPRVLYFDRKDLDEDGSFVYASCDAGCANPANWTKETANVPRPLGYQLDDSPYFALAPDGTPAFVYIAPAGTLYAYRSGGRWATTELSEGGLFNASLAFTSGSRARLVFHYTGADDESYLAYLECSDKTCQDFTYDNLPVALGYRTDSVLRLNAQDAPRILHYSGETLQYLWCDAACAKAVSWSATDLGTGAGDGADGVDLALDAAGKPHISYGDTSETFSLFYGFCSAACESAEPSWRAGLLVEDSDDVRPEPPLPSCNPGDAPGSYWYADNAPSLTLSGGQPSFAYRVDNLQGCGGKLVAEGPSVVRFTNAPPTAVQTEHRGAYNDSGRERLQLQTTESVR